jgi:hypothetical protein
MPLISKSIKDPDRLQWHEVKKVDHYYLSINAVTQSVQVREEEVRYEEDSTEEIENDSPSITISGFVCDLR